jgi:hypothetical protein
VILVSWAHGRQGDIKMYDECGVRMKQLLVRSSKSGTLYTGYVKALGE